MRRLIRRIKRSLFCASGDGKLRNGRSHYCFDCQMRNIGDRMKMNRTKLKENDSTVH